MTHGAAYVDAHGSHFHCVRSDHDTSVSDFIYEQGVVQGVAVANVRAGQLTWALTRGGASTDHQPIEQKAQP